MSRRELAAPLPGRIAKVLLQAGARVERDAEAFVIEALKMETAVYVPCDGTVEAVRVKPGDRVEEDDVLAILEA